MSKQEILDTLMLLSALESWSFSEGKQLPDYLHENLCNAVERLSRELLVVQEHKTPMQIGGKCFSCGRTPQNDNSSR